MRADHAKVSNRVYKGRKISFRNTQLPGLGSKGFDFELEVIVFGQFTVQELHRRLGFCLDASRSEFVYVRRLVVAASKPLDLHPTSVHERLHAIVDLTDAHAQFLGDRPLTGIRIGFQVFEQPVSGLVGECVRHATALPNTLLCWH